jgi:transposase InsO family protein
MRIKTVRCDNAKEQMQPLNNMCWELGVPIEYVAPYTPQQNGKVERQFPTDLKRANAMLFMIKLSAGIKQKLRKEAIRYATTMANISIKNDNSPHERHFGTPSPIKPEHCINFGRIGYATYGQKLKNKYKPRAFKC